jgi:hypothetical protein
MTTVFMVTTYSTGNDIDLTQDAGTRFKVLVRHNDILSVQLNTSVTEPGRWTLRTQGADAGTGYNVIVRGTSSIYFNASTAAVPSAHNDSTAHEGKSFRQLT